jgi:hypothetical protein
MSVHEGKADVILKASTLPSLTQSGYEQLPITPSARTSSAGATVRPMRAVAGRLTDNLHTSSCFAGSSAGAALAR